MPAEPTGEQITETTALAEVSEVAGKLLSEMGTPPRSLHVRAGDVAVEIEWPEARGQVAPVGPLPAAAAADSDTAVEATEDRRPVLVAQSVGVFHRCPAPGADPFVREGDDVAAGQQVAIIEAMKLMLPVEAEHAGRIAEVLKADGDAVEYGEPLFVLSGPGEA